MVFKDKGPPYL
jgi:hypothetical protein